MNFDLANKYCNCSEAHDELEFRKWVEKVKKLDEKRLHEACHHQEHLEQSIHRLMKTCPLNGPPLC